MTERNDGARQGSLYPDTAQLYRQMLKLAAGMEEIRTAVRAIRRQLDGAAMRRSADEGEKHA